MVETWIESELYAYHKYGNVLDVVSGTSQTGDGTKGWDLFGIDAPLDPEVQRLLKRYGLGLAHIDGMFLEPEGDDEMGIFNDAEAIARALACGLTLVRVPDGLTGDKAKYDRWLVVHKPSNKDLGARFGWKFADEAADFGGSHRERGHPQVQGEADDHEDDIIG